MTEVLTDAAPHGVTDTRRGAGLSKRQALVVALGSLLPYGWENTVSGFQVGFHLLFALTVALLWVVASRPATWATALVVVVLVAVARRRGVSASAVSRRSAIACGGRSICVRCRNCGRRLSSVRKPAKPVRSTS
ncbi:MAG TPA: hypothetical protein VLF18_04370 [Tahibacter sp.]|uniref:hypothetical protein n=1 Tax=Tahibacter sp. TaxID=2056211 RepID=UPI002C9A5013|nr:hypothetical protein [Tahibacter sp.]HSX59419.1 hypothetical protein [Tahibacter sp.]